MKFYKQIAEEIQFFQKGYLFLHNPSHWENALAARPLYESRGIPVEYLTPEDLNALLPEFENHKGIAGATFSPEDGLFDPHLLREYYRARAKALGVHFLDHFYVKGMDVRNQRVEEVSTLHYEAAQSLTEETLEKILTTHRLPDAHSVTPAPSSASGGSREAGAQHSGFPLSLNTRGGNDANAWKPETFHPQKILNCTGAWLPVTSKLYHHPSPVKPVRRQISVFSSHKEDLSDHGMMVDTSGLYLHPEGAHSGLIVAGYSNRDEKPGYRFDYDGEAFFDKQIWLRLYRRGNRHHFDEIKHVRGWAGLYEVSPDMTGILGKVEGLENLYELGAATGRGVMQSFALGRGVAELMVEGKFEVLELSRLSGRRFRTGELLWERLDI